MSKFVTDVKGAYTASSFKVYAEAESGGGEKCIVVGKGNISGVACGVKQGGLDEGVVATTVSKDAIGQISFAFIAGNNRVKAVKPDGQEASANYPITRPFNIVTKGAPSGEAKVLIDWVLSAEEQAVVKRRFAAVH